MPRLSPLAPRRVGPGIVSIAVSEDDRPHVTWRPSDLAAAVTQAVADPEARVILLEGGSTYFSAGLPLEDGRTYVSADGTRTSLDDAEMQRALPAMCRDIPGMLLDAELPIVAVAAGHAVGGGFAMALCCDIVLLAEESLYGTNFVTLGLSPGMGASMLLAEAVGEPLAREMLFTGRLVKGREIARAGGPLSYAVGPRAEARARSLRIATDIAAVPRPTVVELKRLLASRRRAALEVVLEQECAAQTRLLGMAEIRSRMAAAYGAPAGTGEE